MQYTCSDTVTVVSRRAVRLQEYTGMQYCCSGAGGEDKDNLPEIMLASKMQSAMHIYATLYMLGFLVLVEALHSCDDQVVGWTPYQENVTGAIVELYTMVNLHMLLQGVPVGILRRARYFQIPTVITLALCRFEAPRVIKCGLDSVNQVLCVEQPRPLFSMQRFLSTGSHLLFC